jgi:LysR family nitrogen assimilation transcriptional regulator
VEVTFSDDYGATFIDCVSGGQLDAALINKPRARLSLDSQPLLGEEMVLVTGAVHGPDLPHAIELARLPELELVLATERHGLAWHTGYRRPARRRTARATLRSTC